MSCDHELANEWARCSGKNVSYITTILIHAPYLYGFKIGTFGGKTYCFVGWSRSVTKIV